MPEEEFQGWHWERVPGLAAKCDWSLDCLDAADNVLVMDPDLARAIEKGLTEGHIKTMCERHSEAFMEYGRRHYGHLRR